MNVFTLTGEVLLKGTEEAISELKRLEEQAELTAKRLSELNKNINVRLADISTNVNIVSKSMTNASKSSKAFESDFSKAMGKVGKTLAGVLSTYKIIQFAKSVTEASAEVTAEVVAFAQIIGDYADTATTKMEEMAESAGIVSTRITPHMTNLTAKFKGLGFEVDEATDLAVRGLQMAADASAFWDISLEQSMEHMKSFLNGNYEGGEAIGLFANETQMAYYGIEKGLIASRKAWIHLDEAVKQSIRLEFAERMFDQAQITGHAAKESEHYANVLANLKESFRQLKASIGDSYLIDLLIPAMKNLQRTFEEINENVDRFDAWLKDNEVIKHFSELWTELAIEAGISIGQIQYQLEEFFDWLVHDSVISPLIEPIVQWASDFTENFIKACKGEIGWDEVLPVTSSPIIEAALKWTSETIDALENGDWAVLAGKVLQIASLKIGLGLLAGTTTSLLNSIISGLGLVTSGGTATLLGTSVLLGVTTIGVRLTEAVNEKGLNFEEFGADLIAALAVGIGVGSFFNPSVGVLAFDLMMNFKVGSKSLEAFTNSEVGQKILHYNNQVKSVEDEIAEIQKDAILGLFEGTKDAKKVGVQTGGSFANGMMAVLEIKSPSKVTERMGNFLVEGLEIGLNGTESLGVKTGNSLIRGMQNSLEIHSPSEKTILLASYLLDGFELGLETIDELGSEAGQNILDGMYNLIEDDSAFDVGKLIGEAIAAGLITELEAETLSDWTSYILNNPREKPKVPSNNFTGTRYGVDLGEFDKYSWLVDRLATKEDSLKDTQNAVYSARAKYGNDSPEAKAAEENLRILESQIAKLKENIEFIENPPNDSFFGGLKDLIDGVNDRTTNWKNNVGQYVGQIEDMFSDASDFVMDFASTIDDIGFTKMEVEVSKLENELKVLEDEITTLEEEQKKKRDEDLDELERQLRDKEICHEEYYARKQEIEDEYADFEDEYAEQKEAKEKELLAKKNELAKKQFEAEKRNQYANILINTASGIMRAFSENWWPVALGISAAIAGMAVAQKKVVDQQEFVPMMAKGGIVDSATHAIIGEDGREAVVPLENNLEWVGGLADALTPAISPNVRSFTPELSSIRTEVVELRRMLAEYLPQIIDKDTQISIDGRVLSNAIAPMIDRNLGSISRLKARGV